MALLRAVPEGVFHYKGESSDRFREYANGLRERWSPSGECAAALDKYLNTFEII
ncbi:MAG: hypothetical protein ACK5HT_18455 [Draconibacterium sp.]